MVTKITTNVVKKTVITDKSVEKKTGRTGFKPATTPYDVAVPPEFNFADHKPLKKKNFASEELYYNHRAAEMDYKAGLWRKKAEEAKAAGTPKARQAKRRLEKMMVKLEEMKKELAAQGVDVTKLALAS
jgi:hypothetical protein